MGELAVIWDLNGVIIDDMSFHLKSFQAVLRELGFDMTEEYFVANCTGTPPNEVFAAILPGIDNPVSLEEAMERKRATYFEMIRGRMRMLPGVRTLMEDLALEGVKQAVASGATRLEVETILDEFVIAGFFGAVVACEDVTCGKPDPEPFVKAAMGLGIEPASCVVIEDGEYGVRAAGACGMKSIAVTNTQSPETLARADMIVGSLEEIDVRTIAGLFLPQSALRTEN